MFSHLIGVEKNNDDAKRHFFSGNRHDAAKDILVTEARLEHLEYEVPTCVRQKRGYTKRDTDYWENGIRENRKRPSIEEHEV